MKLTPKHLPFAQLADLAEGRLRSEEQTAARAHVSGCSRCSAQLAQLEKVFHLMRTDASEPAPRAALARVVGLFGARAAEEKPSAVRRLLAALSFDSAQLTPAFGLRSGQPAARQLLYTAGERDLDLRVQAGGAGVVVSGQVLGEECGGGRVELQGAGAAVAAHLNAQCEFALPPVPAGTYTLRVRMSDAEVEVSALELVA